MPGAGRASQPGSNSNSSGSRPSSLLPTPHPPSGAFHMERGNQPGPVLLPRLQTPTRPPGAGQRLGGGRLPEHHHGVRRTAKRPAAAGRPRGRCRPPPGFRAPAPSRPRRVRQVGGRGVGQRCGGTPPVCRPHARPDPHGRPAGGCQGRVGQVPGRRRGPPGDPRVLAASRAGPSSPAGGGLPRLAVRRRHSSRPAGAPAAPARFPDRRVPLGAEGAGPHRPRPV